MPPDQLQKVLNSLNANPKAFGRRAPEKLTKKDRDELGTPILPGQEDWAPEKRKAVRDYTEWLARNLDQMERAEPTGRRYSEGRFSGVRSKTRGTPFEGLGASPSKIVKALKRDEGNRLELEALDAVHKSGEWEAPEEAEAYREEPRDAYETDEGDASFNPEDFEGEAPKYAVRRPAPGQRGLPGIGEDVAPREREQEKRGPRQADMFGQGAMLQGTERKGTEAREAGGSLFTQERDARERREAGAQRTLGEEETPPDWLEMLMRGEELPGSKGKSAAESAYEAKDAAELETRRARVEDIQRQRANLEAQRADWAGREYKANAKRVGVGDPEEGGSRSVGALNEGRRNRTIKAIDERLAELRAEEKRLGPSAQRTLGEEPRGVPTERAAQETNEKAENFKRWFGDSKVRDENGEPLRVYHHTYESFNEFKPGGFDPTLSGTAIWLTPERNSEEAPFAHQRHMAVLRGKAEGFSPRDGERLMQLRDELHAWNVAERKIEDADPRDQYRLRQKLPKYPKAQYEEMRRLEAKSGKASQGEVPGLNVIPAYVSLKNPKILKGKQRDKATLMYPDTVAKLKAAGHDGVMAYEGNKLVEVVAFEPNQIKSATGNRGTYDPYSTDIRYSAKQNERGFFSQLSRAMDETKQVAGKAEDWNRYLRDQKRGVKAEELKWTGLDDFLAARKGQKVTKQEIQDFLKQNEVQVEETTLGAGTSEDSWQLRYKDGSGSFQSYPSRVEAEAAIDSIGGRDRMEVVPTPSKQSRPTKFSQYQEPGGENYRELLLTTPPKGAKWNEKVLHTFKNAQDANRAATALEKARTPEMRSDRTYTVRPSEKVPGETDVIERRAGSSSEAFKSGHFDEPNILAHVRFNERTDADGKRVLFLEEIQSDWAQKGRREGFAAPDRDQKSRDVRARLDAGKRELTELNADIRRMAEEGKLDEIKARFPELKARKVELEIEQTTLLDEYEGLVKSKGTPAGPFVGKTEAWSELAMKRMIRWAAENGFDRIAWTKGEQQAARYDLSKQVSRVFLSDMVHAEGGEGLAHGDLVVTDKMGRDIITEKGVSPKRIEELIGKEAAERLINAPTSIARKGTPQASHELNGEGLKVGGEGMKGFYDKILPGVAGKLGKKFGAQVGETNLEPGVGKWKVTHPDYTTGNYGEFNTRAEAERLTSGYGPDEFRNRFQITQAKSPKTVHSMDITPEMRRSVVEQGQPLFAAGKSAQARHPLTIERVKAALPGFDFETAEDGSHVAKLQGGGEIRVNPVGEILVTNQKALAESAQAGGVAGEAKPVGSYQKLGRDGIIQIAKDAPAGTEHHEAFHFFFDRALSAKEKAAVLAKYGDEESAAYAYQDWTPKQVNSWFSKIMSYAKRLVHVFKPTWESTFAEARSGRAGSRIREARGETSARRFSTDSPEGHVKDLTALHNITAEELLKADKIGGMPMPSIAITRGKVHEGYGGITLVGDRQMVDPKEHASNMAYPSDAYTARFPETEWKLKRGDPKQKLLDQFPRRKEFGEIGGDFWDELDKGPDAGFDAARKSNAIRAAFLAEKGIHHGPVIEDVPLRHELSRDPGLMEFKERNPRLGDIRPDSPEWKEFSELTRAAIDRTYQDKKPDLAQDLRDNLREHLLDEDGQLHFGPASRLMDDLEVLKSKKTQVNKNKTDDQISSAMKGHESDFEEWMRKKIAPLYEGEFLRLGRKRVPVTLENLVESMRRQGGAGAEKTMVYGPGNARAAGSKPFPSIEAMHRAKEKLVSAKDFKTWKDAQETLQNQMQESLWDSYRVPKYDSATRSYRGWEKPTGFGAVWDGNNAMYEAMAKYLKGADRGPARARAILRAAGFPDAPGPSVELFRAVGQSLVDAPTEYFESKPKRGVGLHEWAGAAVPEDTPKAVLEMLDRRGIPYETYKGKDSPDGYGDRQRAVDKLLADAQAKGRDVKYATARPAAPTQGTIPGTTTTPAPKKARLMEQLLEGFKGSILSGIGTHGVNISSVGVDTGYRMYETALSGVVDRMMGGERSRYSGAAKSELKAAVEAAPEAFKTFIDGMKKTFDSQGAIPGKVGKGFRAPFQVLEAGDAGTSVFGRAAELAKMAANEARRQGGSSSAIAAKEAQLRAHPPAEWTKILDAKVEERQFKTEATPDGIIDFLNKAAKKNPALEFIFPFRKTPGNVIKTALGRTPIGFKEGIEAYREYKAAVRNGVKGEELNRLKGEAVDKLTKPIAGTIVMGSLYAMAQAGAMTGSGPTDPKQAAIWRKTGKQAYSFRVPDGKGGATYVPFARFQPVSNLLMLAADAAELKDTKKAGELWDKGIAMAKSSILNQPYLTGLADVAQFLNDPKSGSAYVTSLASAAVPNIVNKAAQALDPVYRDTTPSKKGLPGLPEKILNTWKSRIPGLSQTLPARRTATGEVDEREGNALSRFASPIQLTSDKPEADVERLLLQADYTPSAPNRDFNVGRGVKVRLTDSEYEVLQDAQKSAAKIIRQSYARNPKFLRLDPEEQKKALSKVYDQERAKARARLAKNRSFRHRAVSATREASI